MVTPERLRQYPFFAGLTGEELSDIAALAEEVNFQSGAIVFREGDKATKLYVLEKGEVELLYGLLSKQGRGYAFVGSVAQGEPFGLSSFLEPYRWTATTRAETAATAIAIDAAKLRSLCKSDCQLGYTLMLRIAKALAERLVAARVQLARR